MSKPGLPNMKCPNHHVLPRTGSEGECTPLRCGEKTRKVGPGRQGRNHNGGGGNAAKLIAGPSGKGGGTKAAPDPRLPLEDKRAIKAITKAEAVAPIPLPHGVPQALAREAHGEAIEKVASAAGRYAARKAFLDDGTIPAKDADEATVNTWVDKKALSLLPIAVLEKEYQLKYGDDDQREKAADSVLKMTGRIQREGQVSGGATIVLNMGGMALPYAPGAPTVEGIVLPEGSKK